MTHLERSNIASEHVLFLIPLLLAALLVDPNSLTETLILPFNGHEVDRDGREGHRTGT